MTWQPIETAPKNGLVLLVHDEGAVMFGWFLDDGDEEGGPPGWYEEHGLIDPPPQHWMLVPEPPK